MAEGDGILTGIGQDHEFVGEIAADGAGVRFHGPEFEAQALEYAGIGVVHQLIAFFSPGDVRVKGIAVLHHELTPAHQAEAGPDLVAEFALDLVEPHGQLPVGAHFAAHQVGDHFLMGGAQAVVAFVAVLEAHHGHKQFLKAGGIDFLAHYAGDFVNDLKPQRQIDVQAGSEPAHHARAQQKFVADHLGVGRGFLEGGNVTGAEAHGYCFLAIEVCRRAQGVRRAAPFR